MARLSAAIAGLTAVLACCALFGAPLGWSWILAPLAISLAVAALAVVSLGALIIVALIAAHRSERRHGVLEDERTGRPAGSVRRGWRLADIAATMPRRQPVPQRATH